VRVLVVMAGRWASLYWGRPIPYLAKEVELLKRIVVRIVRFWDLPGSAALAHAAGAKVYPNAKSGATPDAPSTPMPELGWGPVAFPFPGGRANRHGVARWRPDVSLAF